MGWEKGASVVATSLVSRFEQWCGGQTVKVVSVRGKVGTIQFVTVAREDGETYDSFGDWIAPSPEKANETCEYWG